MELTLERFRTAHGHSYEIALEEIKAGRKESDWIWYIFPQIQGLAHRTIAQYYEIQDRAEAEAYWNDPVLSGHLVEISRELLKQRAPIEQIVGYPDCLKIRSCMTLFWLVTKEPLFQEVLNRFYHGEPDSYTVSKLS